MIDATLLVAHLQRLDIQRAVIHPALELMETADGDLFDEYAALAERATAAYQQAQNELVQRLRELVSVAEALPLTG